MKNKIIIILSVFICFLIIIWNLNVGAEGNYSLITELKITENDGDLSLIANEEFRVLLGISSGTHKSVGKFKYEFKYNPEVFEYKSYSIGKNVKNENELQDEFNIVNDVENGIITIEYENMEDTEAFYMGNLISLRFQVKFYLKNGSFSFEPTTNCFFEDLEGFSINSTTNSVNVTTYIPSTENRLQSLVVTTRDGQEVNLSPLFDPMSEYTTYRATVNATSVSINVVAAEKGRADSLVNKYLDYGENVFTVVSKSEASGVREYKIYITRPDTRSSDNTLKSINGVDNFSSDVTEYNITIPSSESGFTAEAIANDSKAKISYKPTSKRVSLNYGETKSITIIVTAENGSKKEYVLNVTRKDDRSSNNLLNSLTVSGTTFEFNPNNTSYRLTVDNKYSNVIVNAIPQDARSVVTGTGNKTLVEGSNNVTIVVKAENGKEKIYSLVIVRKDSDGKMSNLSNNTNLNYLRFRTLNTGLVTSVNLQQGVYNYEINVPNSSEMVEILYEQEDKKAIVSLEGNRDLVLGKNYYRIRVTAENGSTMIYSVTVNREEIQNLVKNNKNDIINAINSGTDLAVTVSVEYNDDERIVDEAIISALKKSNKTLTYQVFDSNKKLDYSISLSSSNIQSVKSLDYRLSNITSNQSQIDTLSNASKSFYLNFEGSKEIPGKTKVKVNIKDTFTPENILTLYYYNEETGKLDLIVDNLIINSGYVEFTIEHMGDFVLVDKNLSNLTEEDSTVLLIVGGVLLGIVLIIILINIIKRKKNRVKIPKIEETNKQEETTVINEST